MDVLAFIASLVSSLAWPVVAVALALVFRKQIKSLADRLPKRVKAGPLEIEYAEAATKTAVAVASSPEASLAPPTDASLVERYDDLAQREPTAAVMEASKSVEASLLTKLRANGIAPPLAGMRRLADIAFAGGLISEQTRDAVRGLTVMRNLAAHPSQSTEHIDYEKSMEYLVLADAVLFAIESKVRPSRNTMPKTEEPQRSHSREDAG